MNPKALVSIHDLMPETLDRVDAILPWLREKAVPPRAITLLVVPGKPWTPSQLDRLRQWASAGHPLAAHGWVHHTRPRRLYHRLHAVLISRNVAEHLDLDSSEILDLLQRARAWFTHHGLPAPDLYVPPAWALGPITREALARAPYHQIEATTGILSPADGRRIKLPLTGFEADTPFRQWFLSRWNHHQVKQAIRKEIPLRISIHPDDLQLRLRPQMEGLLDQDWDFLDYSQVG